MTAEAQVSLLEDLTAANEAYRAGKPTMSDNHYDRMLDVLARTDPGNKFLHTVEPEKSDRQKVKLPAPMLSTEKAYTVDEIDKFHERIKRAIQDLGLDSDYVHFAITHKLDGMAAHWDGEKLLSRGGGEYGFDITDALNKGLFILGSTNDADLYEPMDDEAVAIKLPSAIGPGEIVVSKKYFEEHLADKYTHPRNFITGAILSDTLTPEAETAFANKAIVFYPFASLYTMNGQSAAFDMLSGDLLEGLLDPDWFPQISFECDYPIDGLVVEVTDPTIKEFLGSTSHHHRWQIAFKRKGETAETTVKAIRWQVGRSGVVTPVIEIESVTISGATINNVTGHNAKFMEDHGIGMGTRLRIIRSGEVIPKVDAVLEKTDVYIPTYCPECNERLTRDGVSLICRSNNCVAQQCRQKEHFFKTLEIKGFGPAAIEKLATVPLVHFFEQMDVNHYVGFGFGMQQSVNLNDAIQTRKAKSVTPAKFLAAFGIDGLGESTAKKILEVFSLNEILFVTPEQLTSIPSVGEKTAHAIAAGLQENLTTIKKLMDHFKFEVAREPESGALAGYKVVFSGKMEFGSRKTIAELAKKHGADVLSSITAATTHLVCGANVGKAKTDKAEKLKVMVLSEENFMELVNG